MQSVAKPRWCVTVAFVLIMVLPGWGAEASWRAGAAKTTITPTSFMWMSGYAARNRPAEGKLTDLWAKALVLQDAEGRRAVLVTLDLIGIDRALSQSICEQLADRYDLQRRQVALCTSHTHTGPVVGRNLGPLHYLLLDDAQRRLVDQYTTELERRVVELVGHAITNLAPAQLTWGSGKATFAVNRRENRASDVPRSRRMGTLAGPRDHDVPVLAVRDADEQLRAIVFGYACHATVFDFYQWSGDYPGFAQMELEKLHPECTALFWAGCGADQNPLPRRSLQLARHYGRRLADAVDAVLLTSEMLPVESRLTTSYVEIPLPLDSLPSRAEIERQAESENRYEAARARWLLRRLDQGESLAATYPYPIGAWRLGSDIQFLFLGGEVVVDFALRFKHELSGVRTWVAGYTNDVMAYIPSRRVLLEGGYEGGGAMVYYGLPTVWAPQVEQRIVEAVHGLIERRRP